MPSWPIQCTNSECGKIIRADDIVDLTDPEKGFIDEHCWLRCLWCKSRGYIHTWFDGRTLYDWRELDGSFNACLNGVIRLRPGLRSGHATANSQPFVFLVGCSPEDQSNDLWFCDYKDTRSQGGKLTVRYGPLLQAGAIMDLVVQKVERGGRGIWVT